MQLIRSTTRMLIVNFFLEQDRWLSKKLGQVLNGLWCQQQLGYFRILASEHMLDTHQNIFTGNRAFFVILCRMTASIRGVIQFIKPCGYFIHGFFGKEFF